MWVLMSMIPNTTDQLWCAIRCQNTVDLHNVGGQVIEVLTEIKAHLDIILDIVWRGKRYPALSKTGTGKGTSPVVFIRLLTIYSPH